MTVMQRYRPKQATPTTTGPFLPSVWPTDIFVHDSWVLVTFKGVPPRRYDSLSDVLESIGIAASDLVEIQPSVKRGAFAPSSTRMVAAGSAGSVARRRVLETVLSVRMGAVRAASFVGEVLGDTGREDVPSAADEYESFLKDEVTPRLVPILTLKEIDRLIAEVLTPAPTRSSSPATAPEAADVARRAKRSKVVVLSRDASDQVSNRELCRTLLREGYDVEIVEGVAALARVEAFDVVVLHLSEGAERALTELARTHPGAAVVTFDEPHARESIRRVIRFWPNDRFSVAALDSPVAAISARVRIVQM